MAAANAITVWLLGNDQSPGAGQASSGTVPAICWQGRTSSTSPLSTELARYATTTISGEASTRAITAESADRARHQPQSISSAKTPRPSADQAVTSWSNQCGAAPAHPVMRV